LRRSSPVLRDAARLLLELALPTEAAGTRRLPAVERDDRWLRRLFERAVGGFYRVALSPAGWQVSSGRPLAWQIDWQSPGMAAIFPGMRTDIILDHAQQRRRIVIDTKFTAIVKRGYRREATLSSGYVYQLYAYLKSQTGTEPLADCAEGLMLHPAVGAQLDETVVLQGQSLRFATVDLAAEAQELRRQLLAVLETTNVARGL
jgi:5-methylcytosine-specific restriction enzyme subunit McrC